MSMDLSAPGPKNVGGAGGGTGPGDPFIQTTQDLAAVAAIGAPADVAYGGSGSGSLVALLKALAALATPALLSDGSGTVAAGGTAQNLFGGATPANGYFVQNNSVGDLWINDMAVAGVGGSSIRIPPSGGNWLTPTKYKPSGAVSLYGATTGQVFAARRW